MRLRLTLVGLFFALMSVYVGVHGYFYVFSYPAGTPGWFVAQDDRVQIANNVPDNPASALRDGDEIVALNGQPFKNRLQWWAVFDQIVPGSLYTIVIRRDGQTQELTLRTIPLPFWQSVIIILSFLVVPTIFFLTGVAVFLLRPNDKQALLLALMLGMFASGMLLHRPSIMLEGLPWWLLGAFIAAYAVMSVIPAVFLHFFLVFPERSPLLRRFPRFEYYLYLPRLLGTPFYLLKGWLWVKAPERFFDASREFPLISNLINIELLIYVIGGLVSLVINYRQASLVSRRKMRVVAAGSIIGFLLAFAYYEAFVVFKIFIPTTLWLILSITVLLAIALVPVSFTYAILRHQVIPVSLILRRSVQYLLAKNALRVLIALPIIGLAVNILADPNRSLTDILFRNSLYFYLLVIIAAALGLKFRRPLGNWVDRKFFREAYNQEKLLRELTDDIKRMDSMSEMSKRINEQVERSLHPERLYLFYREEGRRDLSLSYTTSSTGGEISPKMRIPEESRLLRLMEDQGRAQDFPFLQKNNLPTSEKAWLDSLGTRLIVPMTGTDERLAGLLLLGEKKSEVPYTARDRELLEALADQIALVYENVRLKGRVDHDRKIKHEVLARFEEQNIRLLKECPVCGACFGSAVQFCSKDRSELTLSLPIEQIIEARYQLDRVIGRGGMGAVYEAMDLRLGRRVAVKILSGNLFGDSAALRRFKREAQSLAKLSHPNIVGVHDYGELSTEGAFLVMDLVEGETLAVTLKREGRVAPQTVAEWFDQVLEGVGAAHAAGIIHRDLKPENILIARHENKPDKIKILDFGLAKFTQPDLADPRTATTPGMLMGTLGYMSPEQLSGGEVDERSDLFSIGIVAAEALTCRRPFKGRTFAQLLHSMQHDSFHLAGNSQEAQLLNRVLQKCLASNRTERFPSAAEMQRELIPAVRNYSPFTAPELAALDADTVTLKETR